jgi:hypothetical protein
MDTDKTLIQILKEAKKRWQQEMPDFFKYIHQKGWQMVLAAASTKFIDKTIYELHLPEILNDTLNAIITVGVSMIVLSKLAVKDPSKLNNPSLDSNFNIIDNNHENQTNLPK